MPGDYNADGFVGAADHTFLRDNLGGNVTLPGDTTLGMVTAADYDEWRDNIGMTAASILGLPEQSAAPEPSTYFLLAVIAMVIVGRRCTFVC